MKILQLCYKPPYPLKDGGAIGMNNMTSGLLSCGHEVKVLAISTPKHNPNLNSFPENYLSITNYEQIFVDTSIKIIDAFLNLFSKASYNIQRFYSNDFESKINSILKIEKFDLVILESIYLSHYIKIIKKHNVKILLRAPNIEFKIWERRTIQCNNFIKKKYLKFLTNRLKNEELYWIKQFDGLSTVSKIDKETLLSLGIQKEIADIPVGIDFTKSNFVSDFTPNFPSIFHIGSMDWSPNIEGIDWFLNKVWPIIINEKPESKIYLAGRNMPEKYFKLSNKNIVIVGEVEDATDFILSNSIMIAPLLSGSGIRIKIIEGMFLGKTIISTSIGSEGLNVTNNENILIADNPDKFAEQIIYAINNKEECIRIGKNAKAFAEINFDNSILFERFDNYIKTII